MVQHWRPALVHYVVWTLSQHQSPKLESDVATINTQRCSSMLSQHLLPKLVSDFVPIFIQRCLNIITKSVPNFGEQRCHNVQTGCIWRPLYWVHCYSIVIWLIPETLSNWRVRFKCLITTNFVTWEKSAFIQHIRGKEKRFSFRNIKWSLR